MSMAFSGIWFLSAWLPKTGGGQGPDRLEAMACTSQPAAVSSASWLPPCRAPGPDADVGRKKEWRGTTSGKKISSGGGRLGISGDR